MLNHMTQTLVSRSHREVEVKLDRMVASKSELSTTLSKTKHLRTKSIG